MDLGEQYLSDFRKDESQPPKEPLALVFCEACSLLQLRDTTDPELLFHERYSFKSGISSGIRKDLEAVVQYALWAYRRGQGRRPEELPAKWLDIASNDGTLLSFVPNEVYRAGIDPLEQFWPEAINHADTIVCGYFHPTAALGEKFDVITSVSMFYDVDDPNTFVEDIKEVLAPQGVWIVQQNYVRSMLKNTSIDNVSHEHLAYYSLKTFDELLRRHGMEMVHVELVPINGGCFRATVARIGDRRRNNVVDVLTEIERTKGIHTVETYQRFARQARATITEIESLVYGLTSQHHNARIFVYGASTRGAVLWQAANLDFQQIERVVEINPEKIGKWMSSIRVPIVSSDAMKVDPPDYLLLGPWWFKDHFVEQEEWFFKQGGRMIIPLPQLEVISK